MSVPVNTIFLPSSVRSTALRGPGKIESGGCHAFDDFPVARHFEIFHEAASYFVTDLMQGNELCDARLHERLESTEMGGEDTGHMPADIRDTEGVNEAVELRMFALLDRVDQILSGFVCEALEA